jgi:hypothetical protein
MNQSVSSLVEELKPRVRICGELRKSLDAISRCQDGLDQKCLDYSLVQLATAFAYLSAAREMMEKIVAQGNAEKLEAMARARLADPAYTPSIEEALANPDSFMDGFREG